MTKMSIKEKIVKVGDMPDYLSVLVYGRSGTGKTTFAGTFPRPLLLVDVKEQGSGSLAHEEGIEVLPLETWAEFEELYWYLAEGKHPYKTVVIDTVTQLQDLAVEKVLADEGKTLDSLITQSNWGAISKLMKSWLLSFRDLPMHVVFTAQDRVNDVEGFEDQLVPEVGPRLSPAVAGMLNAAVKVICQTFIHEQTVRGKDNKIKRTITYRLRIGPHPMYLTKIRQPKGYTIPHDLVDPTFELLLQVVNGTWVTDVQQAEDSAAVPPPEEISPGNDVAEKPPGNFVSQKKKLKIPRKNEQA